MKKAFVYEYDIHLSRTAVNIKNQNRMTEMNNSVFLVVLVYVISKDNGFLVELQ